HIQVLSVHHSLASEALVYECRLRGVGLWVWTVDDEQTILRLRDLGIDNIVTNRPSLALKLVGSGT
ncbi:MAG: glycerophosphodiester phosphodiesterase, partial [Armatimonadota bacterium]